MSLEITSYSIEAIVEAHKQITSIIIRCEKAQLKFSEGTSQHTLLKNRLQAMYIADSLLVSEHLVYNKEELEKALEPIASIIRKCSKAQLKFEAGTTHYIRFQRLIDVMQIATFFILQELNKEM